MPEALQILIVEDEPADAELMVRELRRAGLKPKWRRVDTEEEYLASLHLDLDIVLSDFQMPQFDAPRALELLQQSGFEIPFIIVSGTIGEDVAVEAMKNGATDYLLKDRLGRLGPAAKQALEESRLRKERKRVEEELRSTHEQLRQLLAHTPAVIYSLLIEGQQVTPVFVSENIERLLGVTVAEARRYEWWLESLHPEDRDRVLAVLAKSFTQGGYSMEYRVRHKDGSYRIVEDNNRVRCNAAGEPQEAVGVWTDITERKRTEERLREQAEIINNAHDAIIICDLQDGIQFWNKGAERLYGWTAAEVVGQNVVDLLYDRQDGYFKAKNQLLEQGEWAGELHQRRKSGEDVIIDGRWTLVRDEKREPKSVLAINADVTERKSTQESLDRLRRQYELILQSVGDGIHGLGTDGKIIFENAAAAKMLGTEARDLVGKPAHETVHHSHKDGSPYSKEKCPIYRTLRDGKLRHRTDDVFWRKDGSCFPVDYVSAPLRDQNSRIVGAVVTFRDITEREEAEAALRRQEQQYRVLFDSHPNPTWVYDTETLAFLAVNDAAAAHYGYSREEFLKMTLCDIRPEEDIPALLEASKTRTDQRKHSGVWRHRKKNGEIILADIYVAPTQFENRPARLAIAIDVTERKRAEESLREQADIINRAQEAIIVRDFKDQRITFWNSGAERLYGWSAEEAIGRSTGELMYADLKDREGPLQALIAAGEFRGELKQITKDGREVIVDGRATIVRNPDGTPRSVLSINTDITEQKKLETQLLRAQRLESIGTLASGVAHDLNNVLTPILMCAEVLRRKPSETDAASSIGLIEESARRGAAVVKQVLTFARGVEGERVLIKASHLIQEMVEIAQRTIPKAIEIVGRYPDNLWSIKGDPTQLHQVLLNLCVNARDAMANGGSITIAAENFNMDEQYASMTPTAKPGPHVMLRVSDTGSGMPRAVIDKIFDPFFTTKEVGKGTGLGLSTALGIVKSHGGFISVDSEIGSGTTFKVFLPAEVSEGVARQSEMSFESLHGNGQLILVVDDEPPILHVIKMILEKHNYRILASDDGPEALARIAETKDPIDAVITDISMPYMDGVALIRAIKKMKPEMCFIAATGQSEEAQISELRTLHVTHFLTKPFDTAELLSTVRDTLAAKPAAPSES